MDERAHVPVLLREVVEALRPARGRTLVDATVGGGGHAEALLDAGAVVIGIDRDPAALDSARRRLARFGDRFRGVLGRFSAVRRLLDEAGVERADGLLADLGLSSLQIADEARGFSFRAAGPPLMAMGPDVRRDAGWWVNEAPPEDLARIIREFGEERRADRIAAAIVAARPVATARDLGEVVARALFRGARRRGRVHPATRTFQALRIAANEELDEIDALLAALDPVLAPGGRAAVISYHSLEDRRAKARLRSLAEGGWRLLTRKVVRPSRAEVGANPRARSARLRVIEKTDVGADT